MLHPWLSEINNETDQTERYGTYENDRFQLLKKISARDFQALVIFTE